MSIKIYNTLTNNKEEFVPKTPGAVNMYVCGPTVYDLVHIGNVRGPIFFNLVRNWFVKSGYKVTYAYNYTDVDDKIINKANAQNVESSVIANHFIEEFEKDFKRLGLKPHDHNPKVTETMPEIIAMIQRLIDNKKAYIVNGEVLYNIETFKDYGKLSGKKLDELNSGHRVEVDEDKINAGDFVLWKPSKANEPFWPSPWGNGRPGWHIECSAMIRKIFNDTIDIHGGGIDLIFPHHENEIAQGEGAHSCKYCSYWMHNNFINMDNEKMSKSLGNVIKAREFMDLYHPEILKYMFLSVHYRKVLGVGLDKIMQTITAVQRVYTAKLDAEFYIEKYSSQFLDNSKQSQVKIDKNFNELIEKSNLDIKNSLDDDFNTAEFIAYIFEVVRQFNTLTVVKKKPTIELFCLCQKFISWLNDYGDLLGLFSLNAKDFLGEIDTILLKIKGLGRAEIEKLIDERKQARDQKNYALSDELRDKLVANGIELYDGENLTRQWSVKAE